MKGKIEKLNKWKNSKGAFLTISGQPYHTFELAGLSVGLEVEFDVEETKTLGNENAKLASHFRVTQARESPAIKQDAPRTVGQTDSMLRCVALKAAANNCDLAGLTEDEIAGTSSAVLDVAEKYLRWLEKTGPGPVSA